MVPKLERRDRPGKEAVELCREELHTLDAAIEKGEVLKVGRWPDRIQFLYAEEIRKKRQLMTVCAQ
jgi:hypothetical protein